MPQWPPYSDPIATKRQGNKICGKSKISWDLRSPTPNPLPMIERCTLGATGVPIAAKP